MPDSFGSKATLKVDHRSLTIHRLDAVTRRHPAAARLPFSLKILLEKDGHTVTVARNGADAIDAYLRKPVDLVLMDVQMPVMDGYEATRALRKIENGSGRHTPIVALTAHALNGDKELCVQAGMDDYLTKPIDVQELRSALRRWSGGGATGAAAAADPGPV